MYVQLGNILILTLFFTGRTYLVGGQNIFSKSKKKTIWIRQISRIRILHNTGWVETFKLLYTNFGSKLYY